MREGTHHLQRHLGPSGEPRKPPGPPPVEDDELLKRSIDTVQRKADGGRSVAVADLMAVQRLLGNRAASRLIGGTGRSQPGGMEIQRLTDDELKNAASDDAFKALVNANVDTLQAKDAAFRTSMKDSLSASRFAYLAANIMLISTAAPGARAEGIRVLCTQLQDPATALAMLNEPARTVIVPRNKRMTDVTEFASLLTSDSGQGPGKTFDGRWWAHVRGVGDVPVGGVRYAAITEENLLGGAPDPAVFAADTTKGIPAGTGTGTYAEGYSTTTHEFAHLLHRTGMADADKTKLTAGYTAIKSATDTDSATPDWAKLIANKWPDGPLVRPVVPPSWVTAGWDQEAYETHIKGKAPGTRLASEGNYSSQNAEEYFAQISNAYLGANTGTDAQTGNSRNNGRAWVEANASADVLAVLDKLYSRQIVNETEAGGALKSGGTRTNKKPT